MQNYVPRICICNVFTSNFLLFAIELAIVLLFSPIYSQFSIRIYLRKYSQMKNVNTEYPTICYFYFPLSRMQLLYKLTDRTDYTYFKD